jgi:hypothetical protein
MRFHISNCCEWSDVRVRLVAINAQNSITLTSNLYRQGSNHAILLLQPTTNMGYSSHIGNQLIKQVFLIQQWLETGCISSCADCHTSERYILKDCTKRQAANK